MVVPVVGADDKMIILALVEKLPKDVGDILVKQMDYVMRRPLVLERGYKYELLKSAPRIAGLPGIWVLGEVVVCYYKQTMPFVLKLNDGVLYSIETKEPMPIESCEEYSVLSVKINYPYSRMADES
jgi:hypothetical protein